ncbi:MAG: thioesterase family protein [Burkholderiales bacterium]|nr:thioesterase family protein [Burkholderiales bacterium]
MSAPHPLDTSLALEPAGANLWRSPSSPLYWNKIGPFGGWIAAVLLAGVQREPAAEGDPVALQAQFIGAMRQAPFTVRTALLRRNRTTAFWRSEILQSREDGGPEEVCAHAAVTLSAWRDTFTMRDARMPAAAPAASLPPPPPRRSGTPEFIRRYDYRMASGPMLTGADHMNSLLWVRDEPPRALDAVSIAALCDAPFPSVWLRLTEPVMITTLVYNVFYRTGAAGLARAGAGHVLMDSRCDLAADGFYDQDTNLWSADGELLAQTQQLAWFADRPLKPMPAAG